MESQEASRSRRWSYRRKRAVVLDLLMGRDTLAGLAHAFDLPVDTLLAWRDEVVAAERLAHCHAKAS